MQNCNVKSKNDIQKRSYDYVVRVIKMLDKIPKDTSTEIMTKQLLRSATSVGANIVEAQASSSRRDFTNFLTHSLKSANESKYWLGLLRDTGKLSSEELRCIEKETEELANILGASIITLKSKKNFKF
ncbi:four helix bundle protein [Candidatus Omnitrophota bacterium]